MEKILENKKGFTLIELLAVIVVLAIIMVIATMQVNKTIKKSRTNAFCQSAEEIVKIAKSLMLDNNLSTENLRKEVNYDSKEYKIAVFQNIGGFPAPGASTTTYTSAIIAIVALDDKSKFKNIDENLVDLPTGYTLTKGKYLGQEKTIICVALNNIGEVDKNKPVTEDNCKFTLIRSYMFD